MIKIKTIDTTSIYENNEHESTTSVYLFESWDEELRFEELNEEEKVKKLNQFGHYSTNGCFLEAGARTKSFSYVVDNHILFVTDKFGYNI